MSDEHFLTRWARRKAENAEAENPDAAEPAAAEKTAAPEADAQVHTHDEPQQEIGAHPETPAKISAKNSDPPFDLASLPSIESIGAGTDISVFLKAGVPTELARAALRRAWATDPAIRDFIGLSENAWDFTAPHGVPGFGPLSAEEASRLLSDYSRKANEILDNIRAFEETADRAASPVQPKPNPDEFAAHPRTTAARNASTANLTEPEPDQLLPATPGSSPSLQREKANTAAQQNEITAHDQTRPTRRRHGSALPQ